MSFSLSEQNDTIIALATPQGVGAIAVIRLSGKEAIQLTNEVFFGKDLTTQESHTIHFGTIRDGEKSSMKSWFLFSSLPNHLPRKM